MSQIGVSGGVHRAPPVDAYGNVLLPTDGMPPPPGGGCPDFSASATFGTDDQATLADLFSSVLGDPANGSGSADLSAAAARVASAIAGGETPDAGDLKLMLDALKKSIDDGSVTLDTSNLAVVQALVAQSQAARAPQLA